MLFRSLGEVKAPGAQPRLEQILADPNDLCRGAAARGLGRLGELGVLPVLEATLKDPRTSDDLKLDVAEGLCLLPGGQGRAPLQNLELSSPEARAELSAILSEPHSP